MSDKMDDKGEYPEYDLFQDWCLAERKWYVFLLSSVFSFIVGFFPILICRTFACIFYWIEGKSVGAKSRSNRDPGKTVVASDDGNKSGFLAKAKEWAVKLSSGKTLPGKILVSVIIFYSLSIRKINACMPNTHESIVIILMSQYV